MTDTDRKAAFAAVADKLPGVWSMAGTIPLMDQLVDKWEAAQSKPSGARTIGAKGLALIKEFEGCELTAYRDPIGIWTIGYGSTGAHVKPGLTISAAEAETLLKKDLVRFEIAVNRLTGGKTTQNQFDALCAFAFNIGEGDGGLKTSTLMRLHNEGDYAGAKGQFARWNRAGGRVLAGLTRRRAAEAALYGTP